MIRVTAQVTGPKLATIFPLVSPQAKQRLLAEIGQRVKTQAQANARAKHGSAKAPSPKGGGFWAAIANSVSYQMDGDSTVVVGASHYAAAHKHFGGTISAPGKGPMAKGAKFLSIPLSPLARDGSAGWLATKYRIFKLGKKGPATDGDVLAARVGAKVMSRKKAKAKGLVAAGKSPKGKQRYGKVVPLFVLKKSVRQKAEPWFPTESQVFKSIDEALDDLTGV